jgi:large subunit ribosomal protein L22
MGKKKRERRLGEGEAQAVVRNLRVSPRKLNLVAEMIRGKKVDAALSDLEFSRKRIARDVRKCVMSAVANAENNHHLDVNDLVVSEAHVGKNIVMRRFHARGRGRMSPIEKPFSQLTVVVKEVEAEEAGKDARRRTRGSRERAAARAAAGEETQAKETA